MNTQIEEKSRRKAAPVKTKNQDLAVFPGKKYFIILITTVVLLLSMTVSFFAVLTMDNSGSGGNSNVIGGQSSNNSSNNSSKPSTNIGGGVSIGGNSPGKTVAKRSSYISSSAANVSKVGDQIRSNNVILVDLDTYESIAEKAADTRIYPASMTKVMSLLVACENVKSLKTKLSVTKDLTDYAQRMGGSGIGLKVGDELTVQDLLYLTAYSSDTVAVLMLAKHVAGSEAEFVALMNKKARSLGLSSTNFDNCTGLHSDSNYTTCREMAAIMAYSLENPLCKELLTSYNGYSIGGAYKIYSSWYSQRFSNNPRLSTVVVSGGKTGYIDESGFCLVSYAIGKNSGKSYVQVIVGQPKGSGLTESLSVQDVRFVYDNYAR